MDIVAALFGLGTILLIAFLIWYYLKQNIPAGRLVGGVFGIASFGLVIVALAYYAWQGVAIAAALVALFLKLPRQRLEAQRPATTHPFATAIVALISPGVSILVLVFDVRRWINFDSRFLDIMITLPLVIGAFCGRRVFRATGVRRPVRLAGLLAVNECMPFALFFLLVTFLNCCGGDYNPN